MLKYKILFMDIFTFLDFDIRDASLINCTLNQHVWTGIQGNSGNDYTGIFTLCLKSIGQL